jgi:hypothetical protein
LRQMRAVAWISSLDPAEGVWGNGARNLAGTELRPVHLSQTRKGVSSAAQGSTGSDPIRVFVPTHTRSPIGK